MVYIDKDRAIILKISKTLSMEMLYGSGGISVNIMPEKCIFLT